MQLQQNLAPQQKQEQVQKQKLVMTPKLRQSIGLLQLSTLDLQDYINDKLMDNPLLELEEEYSSTDNESYNSQNDDYNYENFVAEKLSLNDFLLQQLHLITANKREEKIGEQIIGSLDEYGFFNDLEVVSQDLGVEKEEVKKVLEKIKEIAPTGIATSGFKEALIAELKKYSDNYSAEKIELAEKIIQDHLEDLKNNKIKKIAKSLKVKPLVIQELGDLINVLNPIPRSKYNDEAASNYLQPDIIVEEHANNYDIVMTEESFPTLRINAKYKRLLKERETKEIQDYLAEKLDSALWLIKSIEQRRRTIYSIVEEIIEQQAEFFQSGIKKIQPLSMAEVAEEIDKHESTVSRATDNKNIQTDYGIFPLKFFFSEGIKCGNREVSVTSIKEYLKDIIKNEDKKQPLSDSKLAKKLKECGISISRRTVAKYRKELKIPSSRKRKRYN
ncbi:RNA polymerase factor sigma-54 [Halanaerobacter jeridensis]|uniref:RNA polymerase sigma-54 factor n=1 Tax=Halanaerobacter jeridensis TaxID=706427 RepID=A0A938XS64_9FIRM|nr:RNA polymerase factor sigma-54 [Halanaerobacter jeridensis]MBM7556814.1 RNA polymerase sigma-54 factor [Halanaerobacter jeridensis]